MNASAYLKGHGWRGEGFSLDHSDRGLSKPLLVAHRRDLRGLGTKQSTVADQWWLNNFDSSLKALGSDSKLYEKSAPGKFSQSSGLYGSFVKADTLKSTIEFPSLSLSPSLHPDNMARALNMSPASRIESATSQKTAVALNTHSLKNLPTSEESKRTSSKRKHQDSKVPELRTNKKQEMSQVISKDSTPYALASKNSLITALAEEPSLAGDHSTKSPSRISNLDNQHSQRTKKTVPAVGGDNPALGGKAELSSTKKYKRSKRSEDKKVENVKHLPDIEHERKTRSTEADVTNVNRHHTVDDREMSTNPNPSNALKTVNGGECHEPHPESIAALMKIGFYVDFGNGHNQLSVIPDVPYSASKPSCGPLGAVSPAQGVSPPKKRKNLKGEKIERERCKREAKREAKHWAEVHANPHLYRPDGTLILNTGCSNPPVKKKGKTEAQKLEVAQKRAAKLAKTAMKEQLKIERRVARKLKRSEKKKKNHLAMQAHISEKIRRGKLESDEHAIKGNSKSLETF